MKHKVLVAQLGARRHYAIPRILHEAGMLERLCTDICATKGWPRLLRNVSPRLTTNGMRRLTGRVPYGVPNRKIMTFPVFGLVYQMARIIQTKDAHRLLGVNMKCNTYFCKMIVRKGLGEATAVYAYSRAGLELLTATKETGIKTILDQTIAPFAIELELGRQAATIFPDWRYGLPRGKYVDAFISREEDEWNYADLILCGSDFVKQSIAARGGPTEKCKVVPYGVDERFRFHAKPRKKPHVPLRVLTIGNVGLRKGSPVVWEAARFLGERATFRMVGTIDAPMTVLKDKPDNVVLTGAVPRSEIPSHYTWADVFLLPSLCEGSAIVTYEAMMAGLPVICTPNTGSVVEDGVNGTIVPPFSPDAVANALEQWIDDHDSYRQYCNGVLSRILCVSVDNYKNSLIKEIESI
jgi:glycosyltransferase involved in cell wall biosynthesis